MPVEIRDRYSGALLYSAAGGTVKAALAAAVALKTDLRNANLAGQDLSYVDLRNGTLSRADFTGANLSHALLDGADLSTADFNGAQADSASLQNANIQSARLGGIVLDDAMMQGVKVTNAEFNNARLKGELRDSLPDKRIDLSAHFK